MLAQQCGLEPGTFVWTGGDCHLYSNHLDQAREQLTREPRPLPKLTLLRRPTAIDDYRYEDFEIAATTPIRTSRRRWRFERPRIEIVVARADNGVIGARRRPALAAARGPEAFQGADHGQADDHGPQDLRKLPGSSARPPPYRADPRPGLGAPRAPRWRTIVEAALALAGDAAESR